MNKKLSIALICLVLAIISTSYVVVAETIPVEEPGPDDAVIPVEPPVDPPINNTTKPNGTTPSNGGNSLSHASGYSTGVPLLALFGVLSVAGLTFYRRR